VRDRGAAVVIISSELDEVLALGDRIAVIYRGAIMDVVGPSVGRERIGLLMAGVTGDGAASSQTGVETGQ
jgi:simple sugar transport system ATP-binding protein